MPDKLTVLILCKDERRNIRPCIEAVRDIADEVLVADSGSTDGTLEIVEQIGGCRVIEREYVYYGDFANWAIPQAAHDWVLIVDADERITAELTAEIRHVLASAAPNDGYWIYRENYFMGHPIHYGDWGADKCLRLFRRDVSRYVGDTDHAQACVETGNVGKLHARMKHFTYWSYDQQLRKLDRYAKVQSALWKKAGRRPSFWRLLLSGPSRFLRTYILRLGFLDGVAGLQVSMMTGYYSFMKQARLWELCCAVPQPDPEAEREDEGGRQSRQAA